MELCRNLRAEGWTYQAIAGEMGLSQSQVHNLVHNDFRPRSLSGVREVCVNGHAMTPENTLAWKCGNRCRACRSANEAVNGRNSRTHRKRARAHGGLVEHVVPLLVFQRDGWRCGRCGNRINRRLRWPNPWSRSLDHIVPLALGGDHTYVNVQAAHLKCNLDKRHTGAGDQLALVG